MLARLHGIDGDGGVQTAGHTDADGLHIAPVEQGAIIDVRDGAVFLGEVVGAGRFDVGHGDQFGGVQLGDGLGVARGDATAADDAKTKTHEGKLLTSK